MWNESYSNAFSERISIRNKLPALQQHASWTSLYEQYPYTPLSHRGHPLLIGPGNWPGGCNGGNGCAGFTDFKKPPFKKWLPSIVNLKKKYNGKNYFIQMVNSLESINSNLFKFRCQNVCKFTSYVILCVTQRIAKMGEINACHWHS